MPHWLPILANSGTPLMWAPIMQLFFGNIIIGLIESVVIWKLFKTRFWRTTLLAIAANYVSMIVGWVAFRSIAPALADRLLGTPPIFGIYRYLVALAITAFVLSCIIEWPILRLSTDPAARKWPRTVALTLAAQLVSHVLLILYYDSASAYPVSPHVQLVREPTFAKHPESILFFVQDGVVMKRRLTGGPVEQVATMPAPADHGPQRLFLRRGESVELWSDVLFANDPPTLLLSGLGPASLLPEDATEAPEQGWMNDSQDLRHPEERLWRVLTTVSPGVGMIADPKSGDQRSRRVAVEVPFLAWRSQSATVLPGDQVVFQLGPQIVLYDLNTTELAVLAMGSSPAVLPIQSPDIDLAAGK